MRWRSVRAFCAGVWLMAGAGWLTEQQRFWLWTAAAVTMAGATVWGATRPNPAETTAPGRLHP